jgi:hypothetical protein
VAERWVQGSGCSWKGYQPVPPLTAALGSSLCCPPADALVVVLTLTLSDDPACKERVVATLRELQRAALAMPACIR